MAESVADLYFRLGLDVSDLNSGFIDAEQSLSDNLRSLNSKENLVKLQTQVKLEGLDEASLNTEGLRVQQEALNRQLEIQQDRINLTSAAYQALVQSQGESSDAAYKLAVQLEQERIAMARLEQQSQELAEQQQIALGMNWEMLGAIEPLMKITDIAAGTRNAFTFFGRAIPVPQVKLATAALIGLSAVITGTIDATNELGENNATQFFADNAINASADFSSAMEQTRADAIKTADTINQSFAQLNSANFKQKETTFIDWARDFFRVAYLLADDANSFSEALETVNSQSQYMCTELGDCAVIIAGMYAAIQGFANSALSFVDKPIKDFSELKLRANELNLSLGETQELTSLIDLAGGDYRDIRDYVRGVQDAVIKGDSEDPEVIALTKYGVAVQDANGKLLPFNETLKNLYEGFKKAAEAGEAESYVIMTNGQAVQDVLPFFNEYERALKKFDEIRWSTSDFDALRKTSDDIKLMQVQADEFDNALHSLGLPLADWAARSKFDTYKELTGWLEENRETILKWEFVFINALESIKDKSSAVIDKIKELIKEINILPSLDSIFGDDDEPSFFGLDSLKNQGNLKLAYDAFSQLMPEGFSQLMPEGFSQLMPEGTSISQFVDKIYKPSLHQLFIDSLKDYLGEYTEGFTNFYEEILSKAEQDLEQYISANESARAEISRTTEGIDNGLSYSFNRIKRYEEELANIQIDLKFGDDDYQKELAKIDLWFNKAKRDAQYYQTELDIVDSVRQAKIAKVEQENNKRIAEAENESKRRTKDLLKEAANINYNLDASPFEQQINAIKQWEESSLSALDRYKDSIRDKNLIEQEAAAVTVNALAKEREAFEREMDRIKGKTQDLHEKIFEQEHSQRDIDIMRVQKEVDALLKEGIYNPETVYRWRENELAKIAGRSRGNADYNKTPNLRRAGSSGGIEIISGSDSNFSNPLPNRNFYEEIQQQTSQDVADKFGFLSESTQNLTNAQESLQKSIEIFNGEELITSYMDSVNEIVTAQDAFADTVAKEGDTLAQALRDTAAKIGSVEWQQATAVQADDDSFFNKDIARVSFDVVQNAGEIAAVAGAATANPMVALGGGVAALVGSVGNTALDAYEALGDKQTNLASAPMNAPDIMPAINNMSGTLKELSETTRGIARHVEQISAQKFEVNVSPTINVDLGGAYVFDNDMKMQLVDDITKNVANAVKDEFNEGMRESYGYGN